MAPPLTIADAEVDAAAEILDASLTALAAVPTGDELQAPGSDAAAPPSSSSQATLT
jgi:hypothetical protein